MSVAIEYCGAGPNVCSGHATTRQVEGASLMKASDMMKWNREEVGRCFLGEPLSTDLESALVAYVDQTYPTTPYDPYSFVMDPVIKGDLCILDPTPCDRPYVVPEVMKHPARRPARALKRACSPMGEDMSTRTKARRVRKQLKILIPLDDQF